MPFDRNSGGKYGELILALIIVPIVYVLSIGPVVALTEKTRLGPYLETIYLPVILLHEHTFLEKPLEAYSELWGWH